MFTSCLYLLVPVGFSSHQQEQLLSQLVKDSTNVPFFHVSLLNSWKYEFVVTEHVWRLWSQLCRLPLSVVQKLESSKPWLTLAYLLKGIPVEFILYLSSYLTSLHPT